ncbi:50S ribosomal protein L21 [Haliovirga abyssi]|uniref:Large ribosomal subunit protein bL21 n=1 Tax=Haliovirga abyssi TaxID=2996794 RepID=A0AAU9DUT8_9FUSO|nr:50S ribosomal protein L21 [Haliovirga abyssi]BDU51024.1 50S ribosomal protein L21 [Haliovirga abyssi]
MYAIIKTGGKQYKVKEGQKLRVEKLPYDVDAEVELTDVLLVSNEGDVKVGTPFVEGAKVVASVIEHGKGKKVINFKYKPKTGFHKKKGHRQPYTELEIKNIQA